MEYRKSFTSGKSGKRPVLPFPNRTNSIIHVTHLFVYCCCFVFGVVILSQISLCTFAVLVRLRPFCVCACVCLCWGLRVSVFFVLVHGANGRASSQHQKQTRDQPSSIHPGQPSPHQQRPNTHQPQDTTSEKKEEEKKHKQGGPKVTNPQIKGVHNIILTKHDTQNTIPHP